MDLDGQREVLHHGCKRSAPDGDAEGEQRLTKRFHLLSLDKHGNLLVPTQQASAPPLLPPPPHPSSSPLPPIPSLPSPSSPTFSRRRSNAVSESMNLDDTRDRIYIHDLDAEIAGLEGGGSSNNNGNGNVGDLEDGLVFLPNIEKRLAQIPKRVLNGGGDNDRGGGLWPGRGRGRGEALENFPGSEGREVVLYGIPDSLTVPREKDTVRKAIIESRQRARERQSTLVTDFGRVSSYGTLHRGGGAGYVVLGGGGGGGGGGGMYGLAQERDGAQATTTNSHDTQYPDEMDLG